MTLAVSRSTAAPASGFFRAWSRDFRRSSSSA
jgi:capsid protein